MLKLKLWYFRHLTQRVDSLEKTLMQGKIEGRRRWTAEDKVVGWHHQLNGHEFEQASGGDEGQESLAMGLQRVGHDYVIEQQPFVQRKQ